ncbi:hypothetical protein [Duganella sp. Root1480D1]|uniref:hypothetical protein n=1 Tax=Duganella sp. Root1480D1 TaxID=1736471 RepID=UPI0007107B5D|nr:hypothetical protein [Duganella sp. Root1480D1]KQZ26851.1 hypothetical protein ASD58_14785 [Duganella sp. Root1480D1]
MRLIRIAIYSTVLSVLTNAGFAMAAPPANNSEPLKCESGPVTRVFGNSQWLVYGCVDGRSMVAVTAPGNSAFPFYFMVFEGPKGYEVVGEGTGSRDASAGAYSELKALTVQEIKALIAEAGRVKK